ncbi:uncharacterized protein G2W53_033338 [Senna tora]|uniref:Uncharacterized protein n=1 Tax=Senna tora TaxID=362788 RepID=A0A834W7V5_9FABA|nr:uncharacterized protein G2W53_033338 [Senna tora]
MIKMHLYAAVKEKEKEKLNLRDQCSKVIRQQAPNIILVNKSSTHQYIKNATYNVGSQRMNRLDGNRGDRDGGDGDSERATAMEDEVD